MDEKGLAYKRQVNYYETDKMGIVHHSNYIRFFEEARIDFLDKIGLNYKKIEDMGLIMPVINRWSIISVSSGCCSCSLRCSCY